MTQIFKSALVFVFVTLFWGSAFAKIPDRVTIVRLLQQEGAVNWVPYAENDQERAALFNLLSDIVRNPTDLTTAIQNRALLEAGKFASDSSGNLTSEAKNFFDSQMLNGNSNSNESALRMSLIQSIEMMYQPESLDYLTKLAQADDSQKSAEEASSRFAMETMRRLIETDSKGRPPFPDDDEHKFIPEMGQPLGSRKRADEWKEAFKRAGVELGQYAGDSKLDPATARALKKLSEMALQALNESRDGPSKDSASKKKSGAGSSTETTEAQGGGSVFESSNLEDLNQTEGGVLKSLEQNSIYLYAGGAMLLLIVGLLIYLKVLKPKRPPNSR